MQQMIEKKTSLLEYLDIFGESVGIRYNHKQYHTTKFGGFVSLSIFGFIIYQTILILMALFKQSDPTIIMEENYVKIQERFELRPKDFVIAFGLQDASYTHFLDEQIYKVRAYQYGIDRVTSEAGEAQQKLTYYEVPVEKCTKNHFQIQESQDYFLSIPFQSMYCLSLNQANNTFPEIEGEFSQIKFRSVEIQVLECMENEPGCKRTDEAKELLRQPTFAVYCSDYSQNITQRNNPFMSHGRNLFWTTGQTMVKDVLLSLINTKIVSDFGLVDKEVQLDSRISFSSFREQTLPRSNSQLFRMTIVYEKNKERVYTRKYTKLIDAFSQVGGIINFILAIGYFVCQPFSQIELNRKLVNSLFDIDKCSKEQTKSGKQRSSHLHQIQQNDTAKQLNNVQSNRIKDIQELRAINKSSLQINAQSSDKSHKSIGLFENIINFFLKFSWCESPKSRLIKYATTNVYNHIDIFNIIRKLLEVDRLKHLLLNEHQIKLFEFLPKPQLQIDSFNEKNIQNIRVQQINRNYQIEDQKLYSSNLQNEEDIIQYLKDSYLHVKNNQNHSVFDRNILKMIDKNLREKLEEDINKEQIIQNNDEQKDVQYNEEGEGENNQGDKFRRYSSISCNMQVDGVSSNPEITQIPNQEMIVIESPKSIAQTPKQSEYFSSIHDIKRKSTFRQCKFDQQHQIETYIFSNNHKTNK